MLTVYLYGPDHYLSHATVGHPLMPKNYGLWNNLDLLYFLRRFFARTNVWLVPLCSILTKRVFCLQLMRKSLFLKCPVLHYNMGKTLTELFSIVVHILHQVPPVKSLCATKFLLAQESLLSSAKLFNFLLKLKLI